jgi:hypothetical protein
VETDWVQVVVALGIILLAGLLFLNAAGVASFYNGMLEDSDQAPKRGLTAGMVRAIATLGILIGVAGAVLGLFFADKM